MLRLMAEEAEVVEQRQPCTQDSGERSSARLERRYKFFYAVFIVPAAWAGRVMKIEIEVEPPKRHSRSCKACCDVFLVSENIIST